MPALIKKEQVLRKEFEESGLDYDAAPATITKRSLNNFRLKVQAHRQRLSLNVIKARPSGPRKSSRNKQKDEKAHEVEQQKLEHEINQLFKRRAKIIEDQREVSMKMQQNDNIHEASIASINDATSFEKEPDIFVTHIATVKLPKPKYQADRMRHELRARRKIYHQCGAVIVELKQGPSRSLIDQDYELAASPFIDLAQDDLLEYCSAYFACYTEAMTVAAFATGGPFWSWANIRRNKTPKWNFVEGRANRVSPKNRRLTRKWEELFNSPLHLGTQESDKVLTEINQKYIYPLLAHTPDIPAHLLVEEGEEEEEDKDEEDKDKDKDEENEDEENEENEDEEEPGDDGRWSQEEEEAQEDQDLGD